MTGSKASVSAVSAQGIRSEEAKTFRGSRRAGVAKRMTPLDTVITHRSFLENSGLGTAVRVKNWDENRGEVVQCEAWRKDEAPGREKGCLRPSQRKLRRAIGGMRTSWTAKARTTGRTRSRPLAKTRRSLLG